MAKVRKSNKPEQSPEESERETYIASGMKAGLTRAEAEAQWEFNTPENQAVRKALSIVNLAEIAVRRCLKGIDAKSEEHKAIWQAANELDDCAREVLTPYMPHDPLGVRALEDVIA